MKMSLGATLEKLRPAYFSGTTSRYLIGFLESYLFLAAATQTGSASMTGLLTAITPERLCGT